MGPPRPADGSGAEAGGADLSSAGTDEPSNRDAARRRRRRRRHRGGRAGSSSAADLVDPFGAAPRPQGPERRGSSLRVPVRVRAAPHLLGARAALRGHAEQQGRAQRLTTARATSPTLVDLRRPLPLLLQPSPVLRWAGHEQGLRLEPRRVPRHPLRLHADRRGLRPLRHPRELHLRAARARADGAHRRVQQLRRRRLRSSASCCGTGRSRR